MGFQLLAIALVPNLRLGKGALRMAKMSRVSAVGVLTKICITLNMKEKNKLQWGSGVSLH